MDIISPSQCRAARALLNWSQPELAERCNMHVQTISAFESDASTPTKTTLQKIVQAFDDAGVEFLPDSGLRMRPQTVRIYQGFDEYSEFYRDIYNTAVTVGGDFCVSNVDERDFLRWHGNSTHIGKMEDLIRSNPKFKMRILVREGDDFMPASGYSKYRWAKKEHFKDVPFYVYGNRLAIMIFEDINVYICVIQNQKVADAYRAQFNIAWDMATEPEGK